MLQSLSKTPFYFLAFFLLCSCSNNMDMDDDILDEYLIRQSSFYIDKTDNEYLELLSQSFGISKDKVKKVQKHIISKKNQATVERDYDRAIIQKIEALKKSNKDDRRLDFVYNILAPYLSALSRNEPLLVKESNLFQEQDVVELFEKFFPGGGNSFADLVSSAHGYFKGEYFNINKQHNVNKVLMPYGLLLDFEIESCANVMQIQDTILTPMAYKGDSVAVLKTRRIIPGLLPSKIGYSSAATYFVIVIDDAVEKQVEKFTRELKADFSKYGSKNDLYNRYWRLIGLPKFDIFKANEIYSKLLEKDFGGKSREFIKYAQEMETVIHEAKHQVDGIEHPELTLNLDIEFSAHVTAAIFSPAPRVALLSAIQRMDNFGISLGDTTSYNVSRQLWELAIKSAEDSTYTEQQLKSDLIEIYNSYRTIREKQSFERLDDFRDQVVSKLFK